MGINEEIAKAFGAHGAWKTRIRQAIDSGRCEHDPEVVSRDDRCAFGQWLYGSSLPPSVRDCKDYKTVLRLHADFHRAAGATLAKALGGRRDEAHADLTEGDFSRAAESLAGAMVHWQRETATECSGHRPGSWRSLVFFWRGRVARRVWATITIPALTALAMVVYVDRQELADIAETERMDRIAALVTEASATADEMQKERSLSAMLVEGGGAAVATRRKAAIEAVDARRRTFDAAAQGLEAQPEALAGRVRKVAEGVHSIEDMRREAEGGNARAETVLVAYSNAVNALLAVSESAVMLVDRRDIRSAVAAVIDLSRAKEYAAIERAVGASALAGGGEVAMPMRRWITELAAAQNERLMAFGSDAAPARVQELESSLRDPALAEFTRARTAIIGGEPGPDAQAWIAAATARLERMERMEAKTIADLRAATAAAGAAARRVLLLFNSLIATVLAVGGLVVAVLARGITAPVNLLTRDMRALAAGQTDLIVPGVERPDEVGEMARAVLVFQQQALTVEQMTAEREKNHLKGEEERRRALTAMAENIESQTCVVVERVASESDRVSATAKEMAEGAERVERHSGQVAVAAQQSLSTAQAVAGASEELSASIREIATQVDRSKAVVSEAVQAAGNASDTVRGLAEAMGGIDQVVAVIADIASQTNLLALNATIEAARAGEAGKGFAVVAHEVKLLANQTAHQTEDISRRIATLKEMASKVHDAIDATADSIHGVEAIAGSVAAAVEEQDAATLEIARNVQHAARAAQEVTDRIIEVSRDAVATGQHAERVEEMLGRMADQVTELGHVLTQVVRTATPEVNRRAWPRYRLNAKAHIACEEAEFDGDLADISRGGACVRADAKVPAGRRATLDVEEIHVPVTLLSSHDGLVHMKLEAGSDEVGKWIGTKVAAE